MVVYIVSMFIIWGDRGGDVQRYIRQPGYIAGLIYGPRGLRYNAFPLYICLELLHSFKTIFKEIIHNFSDMD